MHHHPLEEWQHDHVFGQAKKGSGETRTLIVVGLTLAMMIWEILAGMLYSSMALLADGLPIGSHALALGIVTFAYAYARKNAANTRFSFGTWKSTHWAAIPAPSCLPVLRCTWWSKALGASFTPSQSRLMVPFSLPLWV